MWSQEVSSRLHVPGAQRRSRPQNHVPDFHQLMRQKQLHAITQMGKLGLGACHWQARLCSGLGTQLSPGVLVADLSVEVSAVDDF